MEIREVHPVLRAYDVPATLAFFVDYVGLTLDWQEGELPGPVYLQLSRGPLRLHVSTHHGDGTPGTVLVLEVSGIKELIEELHSKQYRFMNPGLEEGPGENMLSTELLDPAGNMIRFFERGVRLL